MIAEAKEKFEREMMRRAIDLALRGAGRVSPNPMVGAVLVQGTEIVGEGFHLYEQRIHAEVNALEMAGERARGATIFCSLEPCAHFGRTPPCSDALIAAGISRAIVATVDPDPRVSGKGIAQMRAAGIQVDVGLCEAEARRANEAYFKFITTRSPFVHLVVDRSPGGSSTWLPSPAWLDEAAACDAIWLGNDARLNRLTIDFALGFPRHRPLLIVGTPEVIREAKALDQKGGSLTPLPIEPLGGLSAPSDAAARMEFVDAVFSMVFEEMANQRAQSLMVLPQSADISRLADKLTLILFGEDSAVAEELAEARSYNAGDLLEITGYPKPSSAE